jgi:transglutaminase-like putative cysteine protease
MRLTIHHETHYLYSAPIHALAMEARLQPCNDDYQFCQRYRLSVTPKTPVETYTTFNGFPVHYWTLLKASEVLVVSESVVDVHTRPMAPVVVPPIALDPIEFYPYLTTTPLTAVSAKVEDFASQFKPEAAEDWYQTSIAVQRTIYDTVNYNVGCTGTQTTADQALELGCGVCQDYTHLMLATLRSLGIPARYVSGYLNQNYKSDPSGSDHTDQPLDDADDAPIASPPSVRGNGASHAWVEVYLGSAIGWRGFDPTNNLLVDHNFVRIGSGRDFTDMTPVKGVHKGPAEEELTLTVTISDV